ncbi:MAG: hypothetical protein IPH12_15360 [Saprospirales bacterium]|nr:hypothetical protein [Saprospirales bacterium]
MAFTSNFNLLTKNFVLYWVLGAAGLLALGTPVLNGRKRLILLSLAIFSFAAVAPGRRFYGHYWLQFLPVLALAMGALFYHLGKGLAVLFRRLNMQPVVAVAAAVILLLPVVRYSPTLFKGDSHRLLRAMSPGNPFVEDKVLSDVLKSKMRAGDRVAVLGSEPQYYIYLDKKAPSRHFYMAFTMRPIPESDAWQQEALGALTTLAPRFIVFNFVEYSWMPKEKSNMTLYEGSYKYARTNYRPIAWADMLSLKETKFILDESQARQYRPAGKRYVTVYEREEARNSSGVERSGQ